MDKSLSRSNSHQVLNFLLLTSFFVSLFALFTNAIPFVQLGLLHDFGSKSRYVNTARISLSLFAVLMGAALLFYRDWESLVVPKMIKRVADVRSAFLLLFLFLFYCFQLIFVAWARHDALETRAFDLGIFAQAVWNTLQGDFLYSSLKEGICLLGDHVSPILLFTTPFYYFFQDPRTLLVLQILVSGACLFFVYQIAFYRTQDRLIALTFSLIYFFYLPSRNALHEDFHPEVLIEPFIFLAFYAIERGKKWLFVLYAVLIALGKENMLGVTFMLGFYALIFRKWRGLGLVTMAVSLALFVFELKFLVPWLSGKSYLYHGFYHHITSNPLEFFRSLFTADNVEYVIKVFSPFLFLSFFHLPTLLLTAPILFQNLLSINPVMRSFGYHYTTGLAPFVFISAIYGYWYVSQRFKWVNDRKGLCLFVLLFISLLRSGPSEYYYFWQSSMHQSDHRDMIRREMAKIPNEFSLLTHNNLIPQAVNRKYSYQFDYNAVPTKAELAKRLNADYVVVEGEFWEPKSAPLPDALRELQDAGYNITHQLKSFYILRRTQANVVQPQ